MKKLINIPFFIFIFFLPFQVFGELTQEYFEKILVPEFLSTNLGSVLWKLAQKKLASLEVSNQKKRKGLDTYFFEKSLTNEIDTINSKIFSKNLFNLIQFSHQSFTDSKLIRRFHFQSDVSVQWIWQYQIFLNVQQPTPLILMDLAHELTHFVYRENFNPYSINFLFDDYLIHIIEGKGGEVDAFINECEIAKELNVDLNYQHLCQFFYKNNKELNRELVKNEYYKIGHDFEEFSQFVNGSIAHKISKEEGRFTSSVYSKSYPLSILYEFKKLTDKTCQNNFEKIKLFKSDEWKKDHPIKDIDYYIFQLEKHYFSRCQ